MADNEVILTEKQIRRRQRSKEYREKNRERIKAQRHEYYLKNREAIIKRNREYEERMGPEYKEKRRSRHREQWPQRSEAHKEYYREHKETYQERSRKYYHEHRDKLALINEEYRQKHHDEIIAKQRQRSAVRKTAKNMCPAFRFLEHLRLKHSEVYVTKYKPTSDLAHKAGKTCIAIQNGDYTLCPICKDCTKSEKQMKCECPMPNVFDFDGAVSAIRAYAADISLTHQK